MKIKGSINALLNSFLHALIYAYIAHLILLLFFYILQSSVPVLPEFVGGSNIDGGTLESAKSIVRDHSYWYLFAAYFFGLSARRVMRQGEHIYDPGIFTGIYRKFIRINWVKVTLGYALGALCVAYFLTLFSFVSILAQFILDILWNDIVSICTFVGFHAIQNFTAGDLIEYYEKNELAVVFWFVYISTVLDEFGLKNFKSLIVTLYRKINLAGTISRRKHINLK